MECLGSQTIDELGRIILPRQLRVKLGLSERDSLSFYYVDNNTAILQIAEKLQVRKCVFCGAANIVKTINDKDICGDCLEKLS